jgi:hypothetical protein
MASPDAEGSRLAPVRRRIALAKAGFAVGAALVFGTALAVARWHHPGQPKERLRPLAATQHYFDGVAANIGDAGIVQPPLSSPTAATNVS